MKRFRSPFGEVELTAEWERHILAFHPEIGAVLEHIGPALSDPEVTRKSKFDSTVIIFYRHLISRQKFLAVVVKTTTSRNFVFTAYLTDRIQHLPL